MAVGDTIALDMIRRVDSGQSRSCRVYDAIVVGARCAGSTTAMLLARRGYRVLLVDRASFPSDSIRGHHILHDAVVRLKCWGLLERVIASNCPPIRRFTIDLGDFPLSGEPEPADDVPGRFGPRRLALDKILVDAAVAAGAELREGFGVRELVMDGERVVGVRGRSHGGRPVTERGRIVVGADGLYSSVARCAGAEITTHRPPLTCNYVTYFSGVPVDGLEAYFQYGPDERWVAFAFPTNDGLTCVPIQWQAELFPAIRSDIGGSYWRTLDRVPALADRVRAGRREERFMGTGDLPNLFRRAHGPGWALVGDAGYHKDPIVAHGIADAFRDAEALAEAIDTSLSGRQALAEALAAYERRRDEAARPRFEQTCQAAALTRPPDEVYRVRAALRDNPAEATRYFGVVNGTVPHEEFWSPANVARILNGGRVDSAA
jgi:flavin-dependent dehydrogenase